MDEHKITIGHPDRYDLFLLILWVSSTKKLYRVLTWNKPNKATEQNKKLSVTLWFKRNGIIFST